MGCDEGSSTVESVGDIAKSSLYLALQQDDNGQPGGILITSYAQQVLPHVWIGGYKAYEDVDFLHKNKINAILSLGHFKDQYPSGQFIHKIIAVADNPDANIVQHFPVAIDFIDESLAAGRRILVHCLAGVSRSPTIVSAYIMSKRHIHPKAALAIIKQQRPFANPNPGFMDQLRLFRDMNYTFDPTHPAYVAYHQNHPLLSEHAGHEQEYKDVST